MHSAIYSGSLRHRRFSPRLHEFSYPLFFAYLDLAELDSVFAGRWLWSTRRRALARFDRGDHLGDPACSLDQSVRDLVDAQTGARPAGPIRLLTHLRYFGYCFNPVSFFYCFDAADRCVETIVAEVSNTPWGERHCYVLSEPVGGVGDAWQRFRTPKAFHVSPFMPMGLDYSWGFSAPDDRLAVHMSLHGENKVFDATLQLRREPLNGRTLASTLIRYPFMTGKVLAAIYWQAFRLWLKKVPVHTHPAGHTPAEKHA